MSIAMNSDIPEESDIAEEPDIAEESGLPEGSGPPEDSDPSAKDPVVVVSQSSERDAALAAVLREQTEKAEVVAEAQKVRVRRQGLGVRHLTLGFAVAISAWIWLWPPSAMRISSPGPPPVAEEEATLRLVMYFQAQKIEQYLLDTGGVPVDLEEAGPVFRGMEYIRLTNRDYRILGRTGRVTLSYSSAEPLNEFVGTGSSVLAGMTLN